jgi:two-component system sensor histidine kinase VicK
MATNTDIDSALVVDKDGNVVLELLRELRSTDNKVEVYFDHEINLSSWDAVSKVLSDSTGNIKSVEIATDQKSGEFVVYTVAPLRTIDGVGGAVLVGNYLESEIKLLKDVAAAEIFLFGEPPRIFGSTLTLSTTDKETLNNIYTPELYHEILRTGENVTVFADLPTSGQTYRLAFAPFLLQGKTYGVFAVALSTNFVVSTGGDSRDSLTMIFTGGMMVVLIIGFYISQKIIGPVLRLVEVTQAVAGGNLKQRTGLTGDDEVGILAANFDNMTSKLEEKTFQLEEEASKLNAILTSIADGVIVQDTSGGILAKNPAVEKIIQDISESLTSQQANKKTQPMNQISTDDQPVAPVQILLDSLSDLAILEQRRLEIGEHVLSALSAPVMTPSNERLGTVVVLRDITQEVIAEKLKDKFIQSVSHELKTPMFPLTGSISLIKMMLPMIATQVTEKIYEKMVHNTNVADEQANDIKSVVMAMVDLSEIDADSFAISQDTINLADVVDQVSQDWFGPMEEKGLEFDIELPDEPLWIRVDEEKLRQVLRTLLKNARYYTYEGSVLLSLRQEDEQAIVSIKDTGVGILEKEQSQLFTRFYRAIHDKRSYELSGIGLGLYLSKTIVERNGGKIWMESEPYVGSTFSFSFPIVSAPEPGDDDDWDDDWEVEDEPAALLM